MQGGSKCLLTRYRNLVGIDLCAFAGTTGLRKRAGKIKVHAATAPYAHQLGILTHSRPTISEYLAKMFTASSATVASGTFQTL